MDKKTLGVFTGPTLPNLTTVGSVSGTGPITTQFNAVGGQTYYISVGKQGTDAIITTLSQAPRVMAPLAIERCTRLSVATESNRTYQVQVTADLLSWLNYGEAVTGSGEPVCLAVRSSNRRKADVPCNRIVEVISTEPVILKQNWRSLTGGVFHLAFFGVSFFRSKHHH